MIISNVNVNKLHAEFINVGIEPFPVFQLENGDGDFTFPENADMVLVQQTIDVHDPTPLPPQPTEIEIQQQIINTLGRELSHLKLQMMMGGM